MDPATEDAGSSDSTSLAQLKALDEAFESLLELDAAERERALATMSDADLAARLRGLLALAESEDSELHAGAAVSGAVARDWLHAEERPVLAAGELFCGFRIDTQIGRGGMSEVYRARRDYGEFETTVALKILNRDGESARVPGLMRHEQRALARLDHPGIARFVDAGESDCGRAWLAMEYVDGEPIAHYADRQRLGMRARVRLVIELLRALEHAHARGLLHADIKSANVLVDSGGRVRLVDFGIARELPDAAGVGAPGRDGKAEPDRASPLGLTPDCAAPEQLRGELATTATDIYQVGMLAWRLLCGLARDWVDSDPPSPSRALRALPTEQSRALAVARGERHARALIARLGSGLDAILCCALAADPQARYASSAALREDFEAWLRARALRVQRLGPFGRLRLLLRRNPLASAIAVAATVMIGAGTGLAVWQVWQAERAMRIEAERALRIEAFLNELFSSASPYLRDGSGNPLETLANLGSSLLLEGAGLDPQARVRLGIALTRLQLAAGKPGSAGPLLEALGRAESEGGAATVDERAELAGLRSLWLSDKDQLDAAIDAAEQALRLRSEAADDALATALAAARVGELRRRQGKLDAAGAAFELARIELMNPGRELGIAQLRALSHYHRWLVAADSRTAMGELHAWVQQQMRSGAAGEGVLAAELVSLAAELESALVGPEAALARYSEAAERFGRLLDDRHPRVARALTDACVSGIEAGAFADARDRCERALPIFSEAFGAESDDVAVVLANLSALELNSGRPARARTHLDQAMRLFQIEPQPHQMLFAHLMAGRIEDSRGDADAALAAFEQAESIRIAHFQDNLSLAAEIALARGFALIDLGHVDQAAESLMWLSTVDIERLQADRARVLAWAEVANTRIAGERGQSGAVARGIAHAQAQYTQVPGQNSVELAWLRTELADAAWRAGDVSSANALSAAALAGSSLDASGVHHAQAWCLWRLSGGAAESRMDGDVRQLLQRNAVITPAAQAFLSMR